MTDWTAVVEMWTMAVVAVGLGFLLGSQMRAYLMTSLRGWEAHRGKDGKLYIFAHRPMSKAAAVQTKLVLEKAFPSGRLPL